MLRALVANKQINMRKMQSYVSQMRSTVAGGTAQITGDVEYNERKGAYEKVKAFYHSKAEALVADLQRLKAREPSAKVLVFSEYQETLRHVAERLPDIGLQHRSLLGSTTVKKRGEAIEAFMTDPPTRVFLLGAKAGGVGITLTAATHVYIMEPLLNPSLELQAIGRSRRMGQTKPVTVTRMYLKDTIEERVRGLLARRHGVASQSTAMAANAAAAQVDCNVMDLNEILKHNHEEESDDEEESMASA